MRQKDCWNSESHCTRKAVRLPGLKSSIPTKFRNSNRIPFAHWHRWRMRKMPKLPKRYWRVTFEQMGRTYPTRIEIFTLVFNFSNKTQHPRTRFPWMLSGGLARKMHMELEFGPNILHPSLSLLPLEQFTKQPDFTFVCKAGCQLNQSQCQTLLRKSPSHPLPW